MPERPRENRLVIFFVLAIAIAALRWPFAWTVTSAHAVPRVG
jgi:hypothetical protein